MDPASGRMMFSCVVEGISFPRLIAVPQAENSRQKMSGIKTTLCINPIISCKIAPSATGELYPDGQGSMVWAIINLMDQNELPPPIWVDTPAALGEMSRCLQKSCCIAVDTESNSLHAYRERVCLIQFSLDGIDYLVDPLVLADLSPLAPVFADPDIVKIFHAAEYDLICLKRDYHFEINNVFDTMLAARILGYAAFGLGAILSAKFDLELDKKYQKADWALRPMPPAMLSYARMDTRYLVPLREEMEKELAEKGLSELAQEDFFRISRVEGAIQELDEEGFWRLNGAHDLNPRQAAVLKQLYLARDAEARKKDSPPFKVCPNDFLVELAKVSPLTREELLATGLNERLLLRYCRTWLVAIHTGMHAAEICAPRPRKMDVNLKIRVDALKEWRKKTAAGLSVESDVILPRDVLMDIADQNPNNLESLKRLMQTCPWRFSEYGIQILNAISPPS